jgi:precorrin-6x reductase
MILLLGGTGETAPPAAVLVRAGYRVLVSTAADLTPDVGNRPGIHRCAGRLNEGAVTYPEIGNLNRA